MDSSLPTSVTRPGGGGAEAVGQTNLEVGKEVSAGDGNLEVLGKQVLRKAREGDEVIGGEENERQATLSQGEEKDPTRVAGKSWL